MLQHMCNDFVYALRDESATRCTVRRRGRELRDDSHRANAIGYRDPAPGQQRITADRATRHTATSADTTTTSPGRAVSAE